MPPGKAERRYAGIMHLDVAKFEPAKVHDLCGKHGVAIPDFIQQGAWGRV